MFNEDPDLFDMEWTICSSGYQIAQPEITATPGTREYSIQVVGAQPYVEANGSNWINYNPFLQFPGLAREFAGLNLTSQDRNFKILRFAKTYGLLGLGFSDGKRKENIEDWVKLQGLFFDLFLFIDAYEPGKADSSKYLDTAFNIFNKLGPEPKFKIAISKAPLKRHRFLEIQPTTLYGAMWIMVAKEFSKGTSLKQCGATGCGVWMPHRLNKKFCSTKCRMAAHRQKTL